MPRRRPDFQSGEAGAEGAKLKKFSDAGGLKSSGCPTLAETDSSGCFGITAPRVQVTSTMMNRKRVSIGPPREALTDEYRSQVHRIIRTILDVERQRSSPS